ncbi:MAG: molybdate ABC transporter substrate-binding protein [Gemmataceae bacterium]|nr:molybdate ABC transporter substrate-binding protein [Gemmataceae bacterium]
MARELVTPRCLWVLLAAALAVAASGCAGEADQRPRRLVRVAAAADLKFALEEVSVDFRRLHPDIQVEATYGSSGTFFAQLTNHAPFDLFLSADIDYPRRLVEQGQAVPGTEFLYALGQMVVWVPRDSKWDVESLGISALLDPAVRRIAIANPKHAPYGRAAESAMRSFGVYDHVQHRLIFGENVAQAAQFVESGAADIGIIALSLALAPPMRDRGKFWIIPQEAYPRIEQGGVILSWARDREATEAFRAFLLDRRGRDILQRYGFILPGE